MHDPSERAAPASVFPGSLPTWTISEVCLVRLTDPSHLCLVIYTYDLGVRRLLSIIVGKGGSTVSYEHATNSSHCVYVFDI